MNYRSNKRHDLKEVAVKNAMGSRRRATRMYLLLWIVEEGNASFYLLVEKVTVSL
jgi:hypothetical protein